MPCVISGIADKNKTVNLSGLRSPLRMTVWLFRCDASIKKKGELEGSCENRALAGFEQVRLKLFLKCLF